MWLFYLLPAIACMRMPAWRRAAQLATHLMLARVLRERVLFSLAGLVMYLGPPRGVVAGVLLLFRYVLVKDNAYVLLPYAYALMPARVGDDLNLGLNSPAITALYPPRRLVKDVLFARTAWARAGHSAFYAVQQPISLTAPPYAACAAFNHAYAGCCIHLPSAPAQLLVAAAAGVWRRLHASPNLRLSNVQALLLRARITLLSSPSNLSCRGRAETWRGMGRAVRFLCSLSQQNIFCWDIFDIPTPL